MSFPNIVRVVWRRLSALKRLPTGSFGLRDGQAMDQGSMQYWIPCWVSMPKRELSSEYSHWVLVTIEVDVRIVWFAQYGYLDRTWRDPEGRALPAVTAWRELPEPFDKAMSKRWPVVAG